MAEYFNSLLEEFDIPLVAAVREYVHARKTLRKRKLAATHDRSYLADLLGIQVGA